MVFSRPHFGTDGVRGEYGKNLTDEFVFYLGQAIALCLGTNIEFVVGRDTRKSGTILEKSLVAGLISKGAKVQSLGVLPTPGVAFIARRDLVRACVITASHNPPSDNGIKVFDIGGVKIDSKVESAIEKELETLINTGNYPTNFQELDVIASDQAYKDYVGYLLDALGGTQLDGLKIVLDCANGAAFNVAPAVFLLAGAVVVAINTDSDGININENCGATHLDELRKQVLFHQANIGFAFDGDADRLMVVDNKSNVHNGDSILALFALDMASKNELSNKTVVATSMSNGGLKTFLTKNGLSLVETAVGDKYVLEEMLSNDYSLGGEQSGHIIRTDHAIWGDGVLNALLISKIFKYLNGLGPAISAEKMFSLFTPMAQMHAKISVSNKLKSVNNEVILSAIEQEIEILGKESRVIIRPSGTEEVVRITVEGLNEESLHASIDRLSLVIKEECE